MVIDLKRLQYKTRLMEDGGYLKINLNGHTGSTRSTDEFQMWAYVGQVEHLKVILYTLTGVNP